MDDAKHTPVNLSEYGDDLVLAAALPGAEPEDIIIRISGGTHLEIECSPRGERSENAKWYVHEWNPGEGKRVVSLPFPVDADHANGVYKNGVLSVSMPRGDGKKSREFRLTQVASAHGEAVGHRGQASKM